MLAAALPKHWRAPPRTLQCVPDKLNLFSSVCMPGGGAVQGMCPPGFQPTGGSAQLRSPPACMTYLYHICMSSNCTNQRPQPPIRAPACDAGGAGRRGPCVFPLEWCAHLILSGDLGPLPVHAVLRHMQPCCTRNSSPALHCTLGSAFAGPLLALPQHMWRDTAAPVPQRGAAGASVRATPALACCVLWVHSHGRASPRVA